ncbi:MAG: hotdog fold thioesterase [Methanomassiliicoccales archaeon]
MGEPLIIYEDIEERLKAIDCSEYPIMMNMRTIKMTEEEVQVEMDLEGKRNSVGTAHGGAIFSLADQAFALACNMGKYTQVAKEASIRFLRPARGKLIATAKKRAEDEKGSVYEVEVREGNVLVAVFEGKGHKLLPR